MAKIVDKVKKRKDIALASKELFIKKRIHNVTIAEVAQTAGVGKGTVYDYFKNKEDIVFEIVHILMQEHDIRKKQKIQEASTTKEKIRVFYDFFYAPEDDELRELYKELISISLINPQEEMIEFNTACLANYYAWFESILQKGIEKGELKAESIKLSRGLFVLGEGMFISNAITKNIEDIQQEIEQYLELIFQLIEVKNV